MASDKQSRPTRRGLKVLGGLAVAFVAGWFTFATSNILSPSQGAVHDRSDAVVSLAPQHHRLGMAEQLIAADHAETLAISYFEGDKRGAAPRETKTVPVANYCDAAENQNVCFTPDEVSTIGEAFSVREIAQEESWESVTVVTSRTHAFRAEYIFERCLGPEIDVDLVYADPNLNAAQWAWHVAYENAALVKALWQTGTRC